MGEQKFRNDMQKLYTSAQAGAPGACGGPPGHAATGSYVPPTAHPGSYVPPPVTSYGSAGSFVPAPGAAATGSYVPPGAGAPGSYVPPPTLASGMQGSCNGSHPSAYGSAPIGSMGSAGHPSTA